MASEHSVIEWTESTSNPVTERSKISPGCAHCYEEALGRRFGWSRSPWTPVNAHLILHPERQGAPKKWRRPVGLDGYGAGALTEPTFFGRNWPTHERTDVG